MHTHDATPAAITLLLLLPPLPSWPELQNMLLAIGTCTMNWLFTGFTR